MPEGLIVLDLDGTLLNQEKNITERTKKSLIEAKKRGYRICLASGRTAQMMRVYSDVLGGCDYLISDNGAAAVCLPQGKQIVFQPLEENCLARILPFLHEKEGGYLIYSGTCAYMPEYRGDLIKRMENYENKARELGFASKVAYSLLKKNDEIPKGILKLVIYETEEEKMKEYISVIRNMCPKLYFESTGYSLMGIFACGVSKKYALEKVMTHAQVTRKNTYVFGDFDNDLSMFSCTEYSIAMGNAPDTVKEKAGFVTKSNEEDGVAEFLERYVLVKTE